MSSKENQAIGSQSNMVVKPEPIESRIQLGPTSSLEANQSTAASRNISAVKAEPVVKDEILNPFAPAIPNANIKVQPEDALKPPKTWALKKHESARDIKYSTEDALKQGLHMVEILNTGLKKLELGSKLRQEVWDKEIQTLLKQSSPQTLIAVCGATGAGKSSLLNSVLDDNVVPTSGMRACTAVVTEIAYHSKPTIDADVSFLSLHEWRQELGVLVTDLVDDDGTLRRTTDLKSDAGVAWQKVHAVYPRITPEELVKMSVDQIIALDPQIATILGDSKKIVAKDSKTFAKEIGKYIDSKDQSRGSKKKKGKEGEKEKKDQPKQTSLMDSVRRNAADQSRNVQPNLPKPKDNSIVGEDVALWPLIRQVNVRCPSAALSTGAILVDLPGVADANAARNNIAKDYMKKASCIWILAPITRAVDDKTARDLLGDAFKMQLMNGNYDDHTITFIASKCDDISCSEVIRALQLEDDPVLEEIEGRIEEANEQVKALKDEKEAATKEIKRMEKENDLVRDMEEEYESHIEALENGESFVPKLTAKSASTGQKRKRGRGDNGSSSKRRKGSHTDDDDDFEDNDDEVTDGNGSEGNNSDMDEDEEDEDEDEQMDEPITVDSLKAKIDECKSKSKEIRAQLNPAKQARKAVNDRLSGFQKELAKAQREKNAFCSLKRSEFSKDVLREDFRTGLKDLDDAAAEERDPENFDPSTNIRNYEAINLPVFTCSSRDYVRIKGQVQGDGDPACFTDVKDTGIPELQQWCHNLTSASRQRAALSYLSHIKTFATSVQTYVRGIGDVTAVDREKLRVLWETPQELDQDYGYDGHAGMLDDDEDPFAAILGTANPLYTMKAPAARVNERGQTVGVALRLAQDFSKVIDKSVDELQELFKDGLDEKCRLGAQAASAECVDTHDSFASGMHWGTYRATLRRHGEWRRSLNAELVTPFTRNIASSWGKLFETNLFGPFEKTTQECIEKLIKDVEESAAAGLRDRVRTQGELCAQEAKVALKKTIQLVGETMQTEQKEVSRTLVPHVASQLTEAYDSAMEERGTGSVARQKACMRNHITENKHLLFEDGAEAIMGRLNQAAASCGKALDTALEELARKIEVNLAVLWERTRDDPQQVYAREEMVGLAFELLSEIELWQQAEKLHRENEEVAQYLAADSDEDVVMS